MSSNMFACLGDSDDEAPKVVAKKETKPTKAAPAPTKAAPAAAPAAKDAKTAPAAAAAPKKKEGDKPRTPKG